MRIISIDRRARDGMYTDPLIFPEMPWRDDYLYDEAGQFIGWTRHRGAQVDAYDTAGRIILARDAQGHPTETATVHYLPEKGKPGVVRLQEALVRVGAGQ